ncbi:MAG: tetratricopeptide repeat-containing serine protease family protein, partial [Sedimentisphaerales bacterium]
MNIMLRISSVCFCVLALAGRAMPASNPAELLKEIQPAIATVITYDGDKNSLNKGTGFFVNEQGHLITNYGILKGAHSAVVKISDGREYPIKLVQGESPDSGLVKVSVDVSEDAVKFVRLAGAVPKVTEQVIVADSSARIEQALSGGIVIAVRDIPSTGKICQISAPVSTRSIGAPVLNRRAEVIGVAAMRTIEGQTVNFAIPIKPFLSFDSTTTGKTLSQWSSDASKQQISAVLSSYQDGIAFVWVGKNKKALDCFKKVVEADQKSAGAWFYIGYCYAELGSHLEALEAYESAIGIKPDDAQTHYYLGAAYNYLGRHIEAIGACKKAVSIVPKLAEAYSVMGLSYAKLSRHKEAIEAFNQAIQARPDNAEVHYDSGVLYGELGRHEEAMEAFKQAIRIDPDYVNAHYNLGVAFSELCRRSDAIEALKQALRINPALMEA